jgi:ribonuclease P protein component
MPERFRPRERLRNGAGFDRVFKKGSRHPGRLFLLVAAPNGLDHDRLGLAVSRRVGGAVERNRARRLLRECFRRYERRPGPGADLVVVAHAEIVGRGQAEVDREFRERIRKVKRAAGVAVAGPAAAG